MRLSLFAVGRLKAGPEQELASRYLDRFAKAGPSVGLELARVIEVPESRAQASPQRKREEARELEKVRPAQAALVLFDEHGQALGSEAFSELLARLRDEGRRDALLAIGGADGLDPELHQTADAVVSFGRMTWPHQMARIMLAEQLYRCVTILSGHPYHRS